MQHVPHIRHLFRSARGERFVASRVELSADSDRTQRLNKFRIHSITFHFPREGRMQHMCLPPDPLPLIPRLMASAYKYV